MTGLFLVWAVLKALKRGLRIDGSGGINYRMGKDQDDDHRIKSTRLDKTKRAERNRKNKNNAEYIRRHKQGEICVKNYIQRDDAIGLARALEQIKGAGPEIMAFVDELSEWRRQKLMMPTISVRRPVAEDDDDVKRARQRLFDSAERARAGLQIREETPEEKYRSAIREDRYGPESHYSDLNGRDDRNYFRKQAKREKISQWRDAEGRDYWWARSLRKIGKKYCSGSRIASTP